MLDNKKAKITSEQELLKELLALRDELCAGSREFCPSLENRSNLGIFRVFPGIGIDVWRDISRKHDLRGWLTLPIDGNVYPHLKTLQENLDSLSYDTEHDALTGLSNKRAFERTLDIEIERARRDNVPVSLAIMDLDNFKKVNDVYGHMTGDDVLMGFASLLGENKRRYDMAARIGGEEFALILPGMGQVKAVKMLTRFFEALRTTKFTTRENQTFNVTCSAGLACYKGTPDLSVKELSELADTSLYKAKESGKDRIVTAPMPDLDVIPRTTLVHANEKKFLFTGKK